jgi:hypothetical protein
MSLEEHARAIEAAIKAAADDGFYLDDADGASPLLDLNNWRSRPLQWVSVRVPTE